MTIRVVLADDQALVRGGFRRILDGVADMVVVAEASDGAEAVGRVAETKPDVAVIDIRMPGVDGLEATRTITARHPGTNVLIVTTFGLDDYVLEALRSGASGFLLKDALPEDFLAAVRAVGRGQAAIDPAVTRPLIAELQRTSRTRPELAARLDGITRRERDVLTLLAEGRSNADIARALFIAEGTVKSHVASVLAKLELRDRIQCVIFAYESGLVRPGENTEKLTST
jgi:DNA-binding NarL/FixJ family response regulator